jgi:hypothetical protein
MGLPFGKLASILYLLKLYKLVSLFMSVGTQVLELSKLLSLLLKLGFVHLLVPRERLLTISSVLREGGWQSSGGLGSGDGPLFAPPPARRSIRTVPAGVAIRVWSLPRGEQYARKYKVLCTPPLSLPEPSRLLLPL